MNRLMAAVLSVALVLPTCKAANANPEADRIDQ